jgi:hypothetical protein
LEFVRLVYSGIENDSFTWHEVLSLLERHPQWIEINRHIKQKEVT